MEIEEQRELNGENVVKITVAATVTSLCFFRDHVYDRPEYKQRIYCW